MALPLPGSAGAAERVPDPIYAAIKRHRAACIVWDAAIDDRSAFPEFPDPMTDQHRERREKLEDAVDTSRAVLNKAAVELISTLPTTFGGIARAIAYMQRQMRDDGTFMPFDIEFQYDVGCEGDGAIVLGWLDVFLNTIATAVSDWTRRWGWWRYEQNH